MVDPTETGGPAASPGGLGAHKASDGAKRAVEGAAQLPGVWSRVDALVEQARSLPDLVAHRVHLYAASRWRAEGRPISPELAELERHALARRLMAPALLARVRDVYDGVAVLLKGAEAASFYPQPGWRPWVDLDLLVPDAEGLHGELQRAGFIEVWENVPVREQHHHLQPLEWPGLPMLLELHKGPSWPDWLTPPSAAELFEAATKESALGAGALGLARPHHTLLLVAHTWRDAPLARLGHLLDIVVTSEQQDKEELARLARAWNLERLWERTTAAIDHVLGDEQAGFAVRRLTRQMGSMRERTVIETKLAEWVAPFYGLSGVRAARASAHQLGLELRPTGGETWGRMLRRTGGGLWQSFTPRSERDRAQREAGYGRQPGKGPGEPGT